MTLHVSFFNVWAVFTAVVINMIVGALWYSPLLFGTIWLRLVGKTKEDISKSDANRSMTFSIIPAIVSAVFLALVLAFVDATTVLDALVVGTIVSAGFVGMSSLNLVLFESRSLALAVLNVGYTFVSMNIAAVVLTVWK